jgi:glycosyltransferase involved in cell wall biosynthesis
MSSPRRRTRVLVVPWVDGDSYLELLRGGLERVLGPLGIPLVAVQRLSPRFALGVRRADVVHLQWLDYVYRSGRRGPLGSAISVVKAARLLLTLALIRLRGARLVLTVHNLRPHDSPIPRIDAVVIRCVAALVQVRIVHSEHARGVLRRAFPARAPTIVMPFGAYVHQYPAPAETRAETRRRLGIPDDARVALAFGQVRRYKKLDELIPAFGTLPEPDLRLVVAGRANEPEYEQEVRSLAAADDRVVLALRRIPDEEVAALYAAADVAVISYEEVFSSAALILALSLGLPVLVPERGPAAELAGPPVISAFAPGELPAALAQALAAVAQAGDVGALARAAVPDLTWEAAARSLMTEAYDLPGR